MRAGAETLDSAAIILGMFPQDDYLQYMKHHLFFGLEGVCRPPYVKYIRRPAGPLGRIPGVRSGEIAVRWPDIKAPVSSTFE